MFDNIDLGIAVQLGAAGLALGAGLVLALVRYWPGRAFQAVMWMTVAASASGVLLTHRVLTVASEALMFSVAPGAAANAEPETSPLAKVPLIAVIALSVALCVAWMPGLRAHRKLTFRAMSAACARPHDFVLAFMAFYVAFSFLPIVFGQHFFFHISLIYPLFVFAALFLWVQVSTVDPVVVLKQCLAALAFGSLAAAAAAPGFALQPGYAGLIPGFTSRLWGITANANTLASVACALLVLELAEPSRSAWIHRALLAAAAVVLVMTQSKTSLAAALLGTGVLAAWRIAARVRMEIRTSKSRTSATAVQLIAAACLLLVAAGAWLVFADEPLPASLLGGLNSQAVNDLTTMTGRTWIWDVAIRAGMESPLFGQGAGMWELDNRLRLGLSGAVHAHNLVLQVFSRSGVVGVASLLVLLYFLLIYSLRAAKATRGGSVALMAMFLMRSVTEVPLQPNGILGAEFFALAALLFYVMDRGARTAPRPNAAVRAGTGRRVVAAS